MCSRLILYCRIILGLSKDIIIQFTITFHSVLLFQGVICKVLGSFKRPYLKGCLLLVKHKETLTLVTFSSQQTQIATDLENYNQ